MSSLFKRVSILIGLMSAVLSASANDAAGVRLDRTRVVFQDGAKESFVGLTNSLNAPVLVRTTFHGLNEKPTESFVAIPPVYRLDSGKANRIRLINVGQLPQDKESVFYVTVSCFPSAPAQENSIRYALGQRIKLFYRPASVKHDCRYVANQLKWTQEGGYLHVFNPTNLSISMTEIDFGGTKKKVSMILPGETSKYKLDKPLKRHQTFTFKYIDEFGGVRTHSASLE